MFIEKIKEVNMKKLKGKFRVFLYAASGMGINMLNIMVGTYLCSALLTGGFGADAVQNQTYLQKDLVVAAVWSVLILIAKIIDGIADVPLASFTDGLRTRWGRRKPSIVMGLIPVIIAYLLFLVIPNHSGATLLNTFYYGILLIIFYCGYTLTMVTYYSTFSEIVETTRERNFLANSKSFFDTVYYALGFVVVRLLLNVTNIRLVALIVLPMALTMLIPLFMIKEPDMRKNTPEGAKIKRVGLFSSLSHTLKNKSFIIWMIVYSFLTFGLMLFLGGINEYFSFVGLNQALVMTCAFAPVPLTLMLYNKILKNKGFGFAIRYILITYSLGMLYTFLVGMFVQTPTAKLIHSILTGLAASLSIGALFAVSYSVPAQLSADEREKNGVSNPAMYFAVQGLFSAVASGLSTGIVLIALKEASKADGVSMKYLTLIAAAAAVVAFIFSFMLPKSVTQMGREKEKKLKAKNTAKGN